MPRVSGGTIRSLRKTRCLETLFSGGEAVWRTDGRGVYAMRGDVVKAILVDDPLHSTTLGSEDEGLKLSSLCLDESNARLAVAYTNGQLRELDVSSPTGKELGSWKATHSSPVLSMAYSPDSTRLATGSADFSVLVWDIPSHNLLAKLRGQNIVSSVLVPSSDTVVVGYGDGLVRVFTEQNGGYTITHEMKLHSSRVTSLCVDESTGFLVVTSRDQTASVVDIESGKKKHTVLLFEACEGAAIVPDSRLFTVGESGMLKEWDMQKSKLIRTIKVSNETIDGISFNCLRGEIMCVTATQHLVFVDIEEWKVKREIVGIHDEVLATALMGEEDEWLCIASNQPELRLYESHSLQCTLVPGHSSSIVSLAVPPWDPHLLASSSKDNLIIIWRLSPSLPSLSPLSLCTGHTSTPSSLVFSHSSSPSFLLTTSYDTMIKLWPLSSLPKHPVEAVDKAPHLSCASTLKAHAKDATAVDIAPHDAIAVTASMDKTAKLWTVDVKKMQLGIVGTLNGHRRGVWDARFSMNGEKVATGGGDGLVRLFAVADRSLIATLEAHSFAVLRVLFVNNGNQLMSADSGGIVRVWDVKKGVSELAIEAHEDKIWSLTVSRSEGMYVTAGSDGSVGIWEDTSEELEREELEKIQRHEQEVQTLDNLLSAGRYREALRLALSLDRPFCAFKVISSIEEDDLTKAVKGLDKEELVILLQWTARWNTNTKTSDIAQRTLHTVLLLFAPQYLLDLPNIGGILAELLPYTKRHLERVNKARQDVALLPYTWKHMRIAN